MVPKSLILVYFRVSLQRGEMASVSREGLAREGFNTYLPAWRAVPWQRLRLGHTLADPRAYLEGSVAAWTPTVTYHWHPWVHIWLHLDTFRVHLAPRGPNR